MRGEERSFIRISGGIITTHFASLMQDEDHGFEYARPETFARPWAEEDTPPQDADKFLKQVQEVWEHLLQRFDEKFRDIRAGRMVAEDVRRLWQRPILDALGFQPTSSSKQIVISDHLKYTFSHRGWSPRDGLPSPPVIHILPPLSDPDARPSRGEPSPQDALQDCLNRTDATWAMLMNETVIRILREYHHTTVPGYIEFDLEGIFLNRSFPEFLALYRFCHASRFVRDSITGKEPLEEYYEVSRQAGEKIGESLRENVVRAIEELANGFLDGDLSERLKGNSEACRAYYQEVLTVIYRIIFMLFAEQRGLLGVSDGGDLFLQEYSITSLRERVDAFVGRDDRNTDLWEGLCVTFRMLESGVPALGVNAFDGMLFSRTDERFLKNARCRNTALMNAIRALTWTVPVTEGRGRRQRTHGRQRISYADLSVEEIGAIYEGLLEFTPRITEGFEHVNSREYRPGEFMLDPRGSERRATGSYYTNPDLIAELIRSALDPVIADRLSRAGPESAAREKALLSIRICDPACGSGAFLIAASNRLGHEVAKVRAGTVLPSSKEVQAARRDVLSHCIYGVDLNPMAVELTKVSLWINALVANKPLSFLDHHIKCGNSLIGATPDLISDGIPDAAYTPVEGDDREIANEIRRANRDQRINRTFTQFSGWAGLAETCAERFAALADASEDNPGAVEAKRTEYERLLSSTEYSKEHLIADCWCAAFFWPLRKDHAETIPTTETIRLVQAQGIKALNEEIRNIVQHRAGEYQFFHWHLEFPEVFTDGGFDCVLGNPPWEMSETKDNEFFSTLYPDILSVKSAKDKGLVYLRIQKENPQLWNEYLQYVNNINHFEKYIHLSNKFPLSSIGRLNSYRMFIEIYDSIIKTTGFIGAIIPSEFVSAYYSQNHFNYFHGSGRLLSFFDFENKYGIFKSVHKSSKFGLITIGGENINKITDFVFFARNIDELNDIKRHIELNQTDLKIINPLTLTAPIFQSIKDYSIVKNIHQKIPILVDETEFGWGNRQILMFMMNSSMKLHKSADELMSQGLILIGNTFRNGTSTWVPLFEGKMVGLYDHRSSSVIFNPENRVRRNQSIELTREDHQNPDKLAQPLFWINKKDVVEKIQKKRNWYLAVKDITGVTNERTTIAAILPDVGLTHSLPWISNEKSIIHNLCFLGNLNSFVLDYVSRQKIAGNHLGGHYLNQLPILPPPTYTPTLINYITPRVIELTYTAWDLEPFARDMLIEIGVAQWNEWFPQNTIGNDGKPKPFIWDEERRFDIRCDLDALYFHLYEISREDVDYIMETFPIVKRKDIAAYGTYRTKEVILAKYDELAKEFVWVMRADLPRKNGEIDWKAVIAIGETERVEFKESISWNVRTKQKDKILEHTIAKTIASFMNTHGGILFIGVNDEGIIVGLDGDLKISKNQNEDGLRLRFDDLVKTYLGNQFLPLLKVHSLKEDGKIYWAVECKVTVEPVFVTNNEIEEFWIRGIASSRRLSTSETVEYIARRTKNGIGTKDTKKESGDVR
jgi:hypothetical protein